MEEIATLGFITAGMTIIGLFRVLFAFREIRTELHDQRKALIAAESRLEVLTAYAEGGRTHEKRIRDLEARFDVIGRTASVASYDEAARMVMRGAGEAQLASSCGLSQGEAQLVKALWGAEEEIRA